MTHRRVFNPRGGFTLIQMVILVVIASLALASVLVLSRPYMVQKKLDRTAGSIHTIEQAIKRFVDENNRYPCPAPRLTARNDPADGVESCTADGTNILQTDGLGYNGGALPPPPSRAPVPGGVLIGAVPYRTLNVPAVASHDAFDNRITYAVSLNSTIAPFDDTLGPGDFQSSAAIDVIDESGNSVGRKNIDGLPGDEPVSKHYFLFSHGENSAGAVSESGGVAITCDPGLRESENCNNDGRFMAALRSVGDNLEYNDDVSNESLLMQANINDELWQQLSNPDDIGNINDEDVGVSTNLPRARLHVEGRASFGDLDANPPFQNLAGASGLVSGFSDPGDNNALGVFSENGSSGILATTRGGANAVADFVGLYGRGSFSATQHAQQNRVVASFQGQGLLDTNAGANNRGGGLYVIAAQNWSDTAMGSRLELRTTANGSLVAQPQVTIAASGEIVAANTITSQRNITAQSDLSAQGSITAASFIDVGVANVPCTNALSGAMRYLVTRLQYCDGVSWKDFLPNCASGQFVGFNASGQAVCTNSPSILPPGCGPGSLIRVGPGGQVQCTPVPTCTPPQIPSLNASGVPVCVGVGPPIDGQCGSIWTCDVGLAGIRNRQSVLQNCPSPPCYICTWTCSGTNGGQNDDCSVFDYRSVGYSGGACANW